jgi:predicted DNA-binding protein
MGTTVSIKDIRYESKIVWLEDIQKMPWVRERLADLRSRKSLSKTAKAHIEKQNEGETLVGYAELEEGAPAIASKHFRRRIFTLKTSDRGETNGVIELPPEAVDPASVAPRIGGRHPKTPSHRNVPQSSSAQIAVRLPYKIYQQLNQHASESGTSKTDIVVAALSKYFQVTDNMPLSERLAHLEARVAALEQQRSL